MFVFLQILGSLGVFLYGMKVLSEATQRIAGERMPPHGPLSAWRRKDHPTHVGIPLFVSGAMPITDSRVSEKQFSGR